MSVERALGTFVLRVTGVFCVAVAAVAILDPRQPTIAYDQLRVLGCLALAGVVFLAAPRLLRHVSAGEHLPRARRVAPVLSVGGGIVCTLLALLLRYDVRWDAHIVGSISRAIALGHSLSTYQLGYLSRYPNNLPLLSLDNLFQALGMPWGVQYDIVFMVVNGLCLGVTLQATYWLVSMLRSPRAAVVAQVLVLGLVGVSPWMAVPYTDILAMPFVVGSTALVVAAVRSDHQVLRGTLLVASVLGLLIGFEIKTTPVVSVVAIGCIVALALTSKPDLVRRTLVIGFVAGLALFLTGTLVAKHELPKLAQVPAASINRSLSPSPVWWIYMGTTRVSANGQTRYGGFNQRVVNHTYLQDRDETSAYGAAHLRRHLSELGIGGYLRFAANKLAWNWGDGMFWAWSEGTDYNRVDLVHGKVADFVHSWNRPYGPYALVRPSQNPGYAWRASFTQAAWLILLLTVGGRLLRARWRWEVGLLALSVLGIAAFTLVFQGRSRYLLVYVPIVISLACVLPALRSPRYFHTSRLDQTLATVILTEQAVAIEASSTARRGSGTASQGPTTV